MTEYQHVGGAIISFHGYTTSCFSTAICYDSNWKFELLVIRGWEW